MCFLTPCYSFSFVITSYQIYGHEDIKFNTKWNLKFNPDLFPHATLKTFNKFIEQYEFWYEKKCPEPQKHAMEACITKWTATTNKEPAHKDIEFIQKKVDLKRESKKTAWAFCNN